MRKKDLDINKIISDYKIGKSLREIAKENKTSHSLISNRLRLAGIKITNKYKKNKYLSLNHEIKNSLGYILVKLPTHPHSTKAGYVQRSRLVMEKHIGRFLRKDEIILHKNRIKDDDNINNLKIVSKLQIGKLNYKGKFDSKKYNQEYYLKNCEKEKLRTRNYVKQNKEKHREYMRNYSNQRYAEDKEYRTLINLRTYLRNSIKRYTNREELLPSSKYGINYKKIIEHLKPFPKEIEKYHIDHIKPLCSFTFINKDESINFDEIEKAFAPENHQWLLIRDNYAKKLIDGTIEIMKNKRNLN